MFLAVCLRSFTWSSFHCKSSVQVPSSVSWGWCQQGSTACVEKTPMGSHQLCKVGWVDGASCGPLWLCKSVKICDLSSGSFSPLLFSEICLFKSQRLNLFLQSLVLRIHYNLGVAAVAHRVTKTDCPAGRQPTL